MTFTGWLRILPDGSWKPVCHASARDACMALLIAIHPTQSCEKLVLPKGRHPNHRRKPI